VPGSVLVVRSPIVLSTISHDNVGGNNNLAALL
jgi:hypothetical protein